MRLTRQLRKIPFHVSPMLKGRGMDTGLFEDLRYKLGLASASRQMLIGMAAILVIAAVAVGYVLSGSAAASDFEVTHEKEDEAATSHALDESVFVHVSGAVMKPGLYELETGSRVADAVEAAGGFSEDAAEESCNLARQVEDGEHVIIASREAQEAAQDIGEGSPSTANSSTINLNTASASQLESLPGIGASTAQKIIAERTANGPFNSVGDLTRVAGIGDKKVAALEGLVCV